MKAKLESLIMEACEAHPAGKARRRALDAIQWVMKAKDGFYAGLTTGMQCALLDNKTKASVFTGCDNHNLKLAFWQNAVGEDLEIEIIS